MKQASLITIATFAMLALAGCASPSAEPAPTPSAGAASPAAPATGGAATGGAATADACQGWADAASYGSAAYTVMDDAAFDAVVGIDFPGPAECYIGFSSTSGSMTATSILAVFLDDSSGIADFMNGHLPGAGWPGSATPSGGGYFSDPERGQISYQFEPDAAAVSLPFEGPAILVTANVVKGA